MEKNMRCKWLFLFLLSAFSLMLHAEGLPRNIQTGQKTVLTLTGKNTSIVIPSDAGKTLRFAARELQEFLSQILKSKIPLINAPGKGNNIILGDTSWSRKAGLDAGKLARDGYYIKTSGNHIFIVGRDAPGRDIDRILEKGGAWDFDFERATLFGVYDFLERFGDVRFYFPGELGTVVPQKKQLDIPAISIVEKPDVYKRQYYPWNDGAYVGESKRTVRHPMKKLNMLRLRYTTKLLICGHGLGKFGLDVRFSKSHPEYFRMASNGKRDLDFNRRHGGHLCWSSKVTDEIYRDLKAYFTGKKASERNFFWKSGKNISHQWAFPAFRDGYVDVMPDDGMAACYCKDCKKAYRKDLGRNYAADLVWENVLNWADRLKKEKIPGKLSMMSYRPYRIIPKRDVPDNVMVMVAAMGPWQQNPVIRKADKEHITGWTEKLKRPVQIWNYVGKFGSMRIPGVPIWTPRSVGNYYKEMVPHIFGVFMESGSERFLFCAMNYYTMSKVTWNRETDVEALLKEFYVRMFGKAAPEMQKIFEDFENIWLKKIAGNIIETDIGPVAAVPSNFDLWNRIYSQKKLEETGSAFTRAEKMVPSGSLEAKRIRLFRKEFLGSLEAERKNFTQQTEKVEFFKVVSGNTVMLQPFGKVTGEVVDTRVRVKLAEKDLEIEFDCDEPDMKNILAVRRKHDDPMVWQDSSVEIFMDPTGEKKSYYQLMINAKGDVTDIFWKTHGRKNISDRKWDSGAVVKAVAGEKNFKLTVNIPLKNLGRITPERFLLNLCRNRLLNSRKICHETYSWSPFLQSKGYHDIENSGRLVSAEKEMITCGDFDTVARRNNRTFGHYRGRVFHGWIGEHPKDGAGFELDKKVFVSAPHSLKITGNKGEGIAISQHFYHKQFKPGTRYRISCMIKLQDVKRNKRGAGFVLNLNCGENMFFPARNWLAGTMDWTGVCFDFKTPSKVEKVNKTARLKIWLRRCTGTVWVDNVSIEEISDK